MINQLTKLIDVTMSLNVKEILSQQINSQSTKLKEFRILSLKKWYQNLTISSNAFQNWFN